MDGNNSGDGKSTGDFDFKAAHTIEEWANAPDDAPIAPLTDKQLASASAWEETHQGGAWICGASEKVSFVSRPDAVAEEAERGLEDEIHSALWCLRNAILAAREDPDAAFLEPAEEQLHDALLKPRIGRMFGRKVPSEEEVAEELFWTATYTLGPRNAAWLRDQCLEQTKPKPPELKQTGTKAVLRKATTYTRTKVDWMWYGRVAKGKIADFFGDSDLGKSTVLTNICARVTVGAPMPGEQEARTGPGNVILLTAEDGIEDTVKARFVEAGGDEDKLYILTSVTHSNGARDMLSLSDHMPALIEACYDVKAVLCVIDPFSAYLGSADAWKDQDIRRVLGMLKEGVEATGTSVIILRHPPKGKTENPMHAGGGSVAITAACRTGMMVVKDVNDSSRRLLATYVHNLTKETPTLAYRLVSSANDPEVAIVQWEEGSDPREARQLLAESGMSYDERTARGVAKAFLLTYLGEGPQSAEKVTAEAEKQGITIMTLRRACEDLDVKKKKDGFAGGWLWRLK